MKARTFARKQVEPADILSAGRTIPASDVQTCTWFEHQWVPPEIYLEWAKRGLQQPEDDYSLDSAVCYAKRTVCRIIDALILSNHLRYFIDKSYPTKMQGLSDIDISIPPIVHELIIDPRNQLEHDYKKPERKKAEHSVQVSELFLNATHKELGQKPIIALAWNVLAAHSVSMKDNNAREGVKFHGFSQNPMLFIDVFIDPVEVKIVHPECDEICFARLDRFTKEESIEFAKKVREHYTKTWKSSGESGASAFFYNEIKRQAGI